MEKITLQTSTREETGKQTRRLRREGWIPAVIYGKGEEPQQIKVEGKLLEHTFAEAGTNKILQVGIDNGNNKNCIINDVQHNPLTGQIIHADLYLVRMDEKIRTEVPLHYIGESTAVYQQEGTLVKNLESIEVEALPGDLPEAFEVDISILDDFEKTIHVSDLAIPSGVEVLEDAETLVARVEPPRSDEELAELDEAPVEDIPAEEGAEGEAAEGEAGEAAPEKSE